MGDSGQPDHRQLGLCEDLGFPVRWKPPQGFEQGRDKEREWELEHRGRGWSEECDSHLQ